MLSLIAVRALAQHQLLAAERDKLTPVRWHLCDAAWAALLRSASISPTADLAELKLMGIPVGRSDLPDGTIIELQTRSAAGSASDPA